jgi:pilus assembly protein CpaE
MPTRFSIYYHTDKNREYLRQIIQEGDGRDLVKTVDLAHLPPQAANGTDVVLLEYQEDLPELDQWIATTAADPRRPAIFLFLQEISTHNLLKALRLGARECFTFPIQEEDFQAALGRLRARADLDVCPARPTKIITLVGCKGGVGTTFLVANIASLLSRQQRGRILIVDLDLGFGQLNYFFNVQPEHTMMEVIENLEKLDDHYLQNILYPIHDNCALLAAPARLEEAEIIKEGHLEQIIRYIRGNLNFRAILIDAGDRLDDITLKILEVSDQVVLVTAQSIPALANARKMLEILNLLGLKNLEIQIWVNFWDRQNDLTLADVEGFLGKTVDGTISCDYRQVGLSINEGVPLVEGKGRHLIGQELKTLAEALVGPDLPVRANGSRWQWLQGFWRKKPS